jgi:hypothetical protein
MEPNPKTRAVLPSDPSSSTNETGLSVGGPVEWGNEPLTTKAHLSARGTGGGGDYVWFVFSVGNLDRSGLHQSD